MKARTPHDLASPSDTAGYKGMHLECTSSSISLDDGDDELIRRRLMVGRSGKYRTEFFLA